MIIYFGVLVALVLVAMVTAALIVVVAAVVEANLLAPVKTSDNIALPAMAVILVLLAALWFN